MLLKRACKYRDRLMVVTLYSKKQEYVFIISKTGFLTTISELYILRLFLK